MYEDLCIVIFRQVLKQSNSGNSTIIITQAAIFNDIIKDIFINDISSIPMSYIVYDNYYHCIIVLAQFLSPVIVLFIMFSISEVVDHACMVDSNAYMQVIIIIHNKLNDKEIDRTESSGER